MFDGMGLPKNPRAPRKKKVKVHMEAGPDRSKVSWWQCEHIRKGLKMTEGFWLCDDCKAAVRAGATIDKVPPKELPPYVAERLAAHLEGKK